MSQQLPTGTPCTVVHARSATRAEFAAVIVGYDILADRHRVVRFTDGARGVNEVPCELINHPVRIGDGEPQPGETYFIKSITGSPDLAKAVESLVKANDALRSEVDAKFKTLADDFEDTKNRFFATLQTIAEHVPQELAFAIKSALDNGAIVKAKPASKNRRSPEPETANA